MVIPMDPKLKGSKPILRSVNEREGIEFTYSVWLFVTDYSINQGQKRHIFNKGSAQNVGNKDKFGDVKYSGMMFPNNAPGVFLKLMMKKVPINLLFT